jgi:hypothetical protein
MSMHGLALHPALRNHRRGAILFGEGSAVSWDRNSFLGGVAYFCFMTALEAFPSVTHCATISLYGPRPCTFS